LIQLWVVQQPLPVDVEVQNQGSASAPGSTLGVYVDPSNTPQPGDPPLLSVQVPSLAPGVTTEVQADIPAGTLSVGTHSVAVLADSRGAIAESNETNNVVTIPTHIGNEPPNDITMLNQTGQSPPALSVPGTVTATNVFSIPGTQFSHSCSNIGTIDIAQPLFYTVTPAVTGSIALTVTQSNFDTAVVVRDESGTTPDVCSVTPVGQPGVPLNVPVIAGHIYEVIVATETSAGGPGSGGGTFTLAIQ
jgi:hypothetical protein